MGIRRSTFVVLLGLVVPFLGTRAGRADPPPVTDPPAPEAAPESAPEAAASENDSARIASALTWLAAHQQENGSWGRAYPTAVTGLACLSHIAAADDPFAGAAAAPLVRGLAFLLDHQTDGVFPKEGHTWIHGQGFATLALAEAYGRVLLGATKPDLDLDRLRATVAAAVRVIGAHQSVSGGWWYDQANRHDHEGSTTVCAVQALVSAANYGIDVDSAVLARGFEYLKKCQNPDGGFDYKLGPGTVSMKEGTAGGVATLALMRRFDYRVMTEGVAFLQKAGAAAISAERFPYYGHFYGIMGLVLYAEEMGADDASLAYQAVALPHLREWQAKDGSWPLKGWMVSQAGGDLSYATAFAALVLSVPQRRLSIFHRRPPELPSAVETAPTD